MPTLPTIFRPVTRNTLIFYSALSILFPLYTAEKGFCWNGPSVDQIHLFIYLDLFILKNMLQPN